MENEMKKKYLKYKNKYLKLKQNHKGGFMLADESEGKYLNRMILHLLKYAVYYRNYLYFPKPLPPLATIDNQLSLSIGQFISDDYCSIYDYLIKSFLKSTEYKQQFIKRDGTLISSISGFPSHINFASLIYTSFLLEFELFSLIHQVVHVNTLSKPTENTLISNFAYYCTVGQCTKTRIYKDSVNTDITSLTRLFANEFDNYFKLFMDEFINYLHQIKKHPLQLIYEQIVPYEHIEHIHNSFDYIYKDWINRLNTLGYTNENINMGLISTINKIQQSGTQYIAEGTGFFSFIYLNYPAFPKANFGSCITYSLFELYIMSRLHISSENMNLVLEVEPDKTTGIVSPHLHWKYTQSSLSYILRPPFAISHWSTLFNISGKTVQFRNAFTPPSAILNFKFHRKEFLYALLYPILDSYKFYINFNSNNLHPLIVKKLTDFIDIRKQILEKKILFHSQSLSIAPIPQPIPPPIPPPVNIELIFKEAIENMENSQPTSDIQTLIASGRLVFPDNTRITNINIFNDRGQSLLYIASRAGNINLVREIIKAGCDINILNRDGSTPLHGAANGNLGIIKDFFLYDTNRREIIKLLLSNGANKYIKNLKNQIPKDIINFTFGYIKQEVIEILMYSK